MSRRELVLRTLESFPGWVMLVGGAACLFCAVREPGYNLEMRVLGVGGSLVFLWMAWAQFRSAFRGGQQFFRREPLPGPKVIIDERGVHITERGRTAAEDSRSPRTPPP